MTSERKLWFRFGKDTLSAPEAVRHVADQYGHMAPHQIRDSDHPTQTHFGRSECRGATIYPWAAAAAAFMRERLLHINL